MNHDELIDTIQRLIALSSSANEHESAIALARANELMAKHNISMLDLETERVTAEYTDSEVYTSGRSSATEPFLCNILQKYFFVKAIRFRDRRSKKTTLKFFGDKTNVEIANYVYHGLDIYFRALAEVNMIAARDRRTYYAGVSKGYCDKLQEEREALKRDTGNRNALILVDKALVEAFRNRFPHTGMKSSASLSNNMDAYNQGLRDGREINLRKGIKGNSSTQPRLN